MTREERQEEAVNAWLSSDRRSILNCCPRFGKTRVAIEIMKRGRYKHPLIIAPRIDIRSSWDREFEKLNNGTQFMFSTFASIKKLKPLIQPQNPDFIIIDEPHELSVNQQKELYAAIDEDIPVLGLTGTMTKTTEQELMDNLWLGVCYRYTISQGVEEGILVDHQLNVHSVPLSSSAVVPFMGGNSKRIEKDAFSLYQYFKSTKKGKEKMFFDLKMIQLLQNSESKMLKTKELIDKYKEERILVFCGVTKIADQLGIPVYHSKKKEKEVFDKFCRGEGNALVTIQMMQAGITIVPISRAIVNYMSGAPEVGTQKICRVLGKEIFNEEKKAEVDIIIADEAFEREKIKTALSFFDSEKICFIQ